MGLVRTPAEQNASLLFECEQWAARHGTQCTGVQQFEASPHLYFFRNLVVLRCIAECSNGRSVVGFQVYSVEGSGGVRDQVAEHELVESGRVKQLIGWLDEMGD